MMMIQRRRRGGGTTTTMETINAAATTIAYSAAAAENRILPPPPHVKRRCFCCCWNFYWCFGSPKNKRIGHAVSVPQTSDAQQPPSLVLIPFPAAAAAPPSSPASQLSSSTQSPTPALLSPADMLLLYSPGGPSSIFAIGPYAHETQLVSPPVFSTEPSTAPYTPTPESIHLITTPSSPEVPFARLFEPSIQNGQYEFLSYQLHPGSPVSHLISPCSGISGSGTSSPFLNPDLAARHPFFQNGNPPTLLDIDNEWGSCQGSGVVTPDTLGPRSLLNHQISDVAPLPDMVNNRWQNDDSVVVDHRVSFEITSEEVVRCVEKKPAKSVLPESVEEKPVEMKSGTNNDTPEKALADGDNEQRHQKNRTITLGSAKEFNFSNIEGRNVDEPSIIKSSDWWVNEKAVGEDSGPQDWSFFPTIGTGIS